MARRPRVPLSEGQVYSLFRKLGVSDQNARILAPISQRESKGKWWINNAGLNKDGSVDHGLMQINDLWRKDPVIAKIGWGKRYRPVANAKMAKRVLQVQGLKAWATYNSGGVNPYGGSGEPLKNVLRGSARPSNALSASQPARGVADAGMDASALLALLSGSQRPQPRASMGIAAPAHSAQPALAAGAQLPMGGGGPEPKRDIGALLASLITPGQGIDRPAIRGGIQTPGGGTTPAPKGKLRDGGGWGGSQGVIGSARKAVGWSGNVTGKRTPERNAAVGGSGGSDHLTTKTNAYAEDWSDGSPNETANKERVFKRLGKHFGVPIQKNSYNSGGVVKIGKRRYKVQILYGSGIKHADHVHVGVQRIA